MIQELISCWYTMQFYTHNNAANGGDLPVLTI